MLEVQGEYFHAHLKVWFGDVEAETMYRYMDEGAGKKAGNSSQVWAVLGRSGEDVAADLGNKDTLHCPSCRSQHCKQRQG